MSEIYVTEDISKEIDSISNEVLRSESVNVDGTEFTVNWHKLPVYEGSGNDRKVTCFVETPVILDVSTVIDKWFSDNDSGLEVRKLVNSKLARGCDDLRAVAEKHNRDPQSIGLAFFANWFDETKTLEAKNGERHLLTGNAEQVAEDIRGLADLGVTDLTLNFQRDTLARSLDSMQHFAEVIRPLAH